MDKWKTPAKIISVVAGAVSAIVGFILMALSVLFIVLPIFVTGYVIYNVFINYMCEGAEWLFVIYLWFSPIVLGCLAAGIAMLFYGIVAIILAIVIVAATFIVIKIVSSKKEVAENEETELTGGQT